MNPAEFTEPIRVHLGCNDVKIPEWVNVDARPTTATDLVHDCGNLEPFRDGSVSTVFSHAFFEHLTMAGRSALLADIHRVLRDDGFVHFCGIPDFENIARCYLERRPGNISPAFDLFEVYRYTHGDPESQPQWWLEQLHKTLFDVPTVKRLLAAAGFATSFIYRYSYGNEPNRINLGFFARKDPRPYAHDEALALIRAFSAFNRPNLGTVEMNL